MVKIKHTHTHDTHIQECTNENTRAHNGDVVDFSVVLLQLFKCVCAREKETERTGAILKLHSFFFYMYEKWLLFFFQSQCAGKFKKET